MPSEVYQQELTQEADLKQFISDELLYIKPVYWDDIILNIKKVDGVFTHCISSSECSQETLSPSSEILDAINQFQAFYKDVKNIYLETMHFSLSRNEMGEWRGINQCKDTSGNQLVASQWEVTTEYTSSTADIDAGMYREEMISGYTINEKGEKSFFIKRGSLDQVRTVPRKRLQEKLRTIFYVIITLLSLISIICMFLPLFIDVRTTVDYLSPWFTVCIIYVLSFLGLMFLNKKGILGNIVKAILAGGVMGAPPAYYGAPSLLHYFVENKGEFEVTVTDKHEHWSANSAIERCTPRLIIKEFTPIWGANHLCPPYSLYDSISVGDKLIITGNISPYGVTPDAVQWKDSFWRER